MILEYCKPPAASIEDPLTYSILTASYVYGNDSRTLLDELENIFFDALNDHIQTKNSCGHHFWQALIVKQNVAQNMKSAKYLFRHADDDLDNPFHYTKPLDLRKLAILTKARYSIVYDNDNFIILILTICSLKTVCSIRFSSLSLFQTRNCG